MSEVLWPPDLIPASQTWGGLGNAAVFTGPFSGASRTYSRPGSLMRCAITLPMMRGSDRARWMALLAQIRDRGGRVWMPDFSVTKRGSFPADELFTNHDFSNGTTGWTAENVTLSVADRIMRVAPSTVATHDFLQSVALTQYAPHALRSFLSDGEQSSGLNIGPSISASAASSIGTSRGLVTVGNVALSAASQAHYPALGSSTSGYTVGMNFNVHWTSLTRCFQVDGGGNLLTYSDQFDNAAWTPTGCTISANAGTAPDGTTTADNIVEDGATSGHDVQHSAVTVPSAAADYAFTCAVKQGGRGWCYIQMTELTGTTSVNVFVDLVSGALGTIGTGANWSNARAFITNLGDGWRGISLVARKTNAATSIRTYVGAATADATPSYAGSAATHAISMWRATLVQSSTPVRLTQSTDAAVSASTQTGSGIYVKGLPASTAGLLEIGDFVQIGAQMNRVTARLNSDSAGRGYLQCGNPFRYATNDAAGIVNTPMCKMMLATDSYDIDTGPGQFSSVTLEFVEAID